MSTQMEIPASKRRPRINAEPDKNLLTSLLQGNSYAIQSALSMKNSAALAAVEEAIAIKSGNPNIEFYRPGGIVTINPADRHEAFMKLTLMAGQNGLLQNTAYTQSLIAMMGEQQNQAFMHLMQADTQMVFCYQLLGIQMQLAIMVQQHSAPQKKPITTNLNQSNHLKPPPVMPHPLPPKVAKLEPQTEIKTNEIIWAFLAYLAATSAYHLFSGRLQLGIPPNSIVALVALLLVNLVLFYFIFRFSNANSEKWLAFGAAISLVETIAALFFTNTGNNSSSQIVTLVSALVKQFIVLMAALWITKKLLKHTSRSIINAVFFAVTSGLIAMLWNKYWGFVMQPLIKIKLIWAINTASLLRTLIIVLISSLLLLGFSKIIEKFFKPAR